MVCIWILHIGETASNPCDLVDAASGGFVAPFAHPKLVWDFKIPRVVSINTSGHKYGLACVGIGWVVWRSKTFLPTDLIFELHYLGSVEYSFSLNFSRPAHPIISQYFNLIHLGFEGYRAIALADLKNARLLSRALERTGWYTVLSDVHRQKLEISKSAQAIIGVDEENPEVTRCVIWIVTLNLIIIILSPMKKGFLW